MRQSLIRKLKQQQGFSLLIVLAILLVISFIVIGSAQYINTDLKISANDGDRKVAFSYAEATLKHAEGKLIAIESDLNIPDKTVQELIDANVFTESCASTEAGTWTKGLCRSSTTAMVVDGYAATGIWSQAVGDAVPAWQRKDSSSIAVLSPCGNSQEYVINADGGICSGTTVTKGDITWSNPHYIIELLDKEESGTRNYRVTARAWGKNKNTVVTLQSYVAVGE